MPRPCFQAALSGSIALFLLLGAGAGSGARLAAAGGEVRPRQAPAAQALKAPSALTVTSASKSAVVLAWTTGDPQSSKFVVERRLAGAAWPAAPAAGRGSAPAAGAAPPLPTPSAVMTADGTSATDNKIDAFATYVYRVRALGASDAVSSPSNEVTVGPPPVGYSQIVLDPKGTTEHDPNQFANQLRIVHDANGDPALAYVTSDLNGDGDPSDSALDAITWSRARYRWNSPVRIDMVGDVAKGGSRPSLSLSFDDSAQRFGLAYLTNDHNLSIAFSDDGGGTWRKAVVEKTGNDEAVLSTPSLALAGGRVHLAYAISGTGVRYRTGAETDAPDKWTAAMAPVVAGTQEIHTEGIGLTVDAAGKPAVAYFIDPAEGYNLTLAVWRPTGATAVKAADTNNRQTDGPALSMTAAGQQLAILFYANRDEDFFADGHHLWFIKSTDGGATWTAPVVVADDGGNNMGAPLSLTLDRAGRAAAVAELTGGNQDGTKCGVPKLMRSADGVRWTTCAPETKGSPQQDITYPVAFVADNDKLYVAYRQRAAQPLAPGLVLWRER